MGGNAALITVELGLGYRRLYYASPGGILLQRVYV